MGCGGRSGSPAGGRRRHPPAGGLFLVAGHVVALETQEVAQPVGEEGSGDALGQGLLSPHADQAGLVQQVADQGRGLQPEVFHEIPTAQQRLLLGQGAEPFEIVTQQILYKVGGPIDGGVGFFLFSQGVPEGMQQHLRCPGLAFPE